MQKILTSFSGKMRKMATKQENTRGRPLIGIDEMNMVDFPGEPDGFELVARFCYNNGRIVMNPSNICVLHCSAVFMEMTEELAPCNLISQAETFLDGLFYWTWDEILTSVKTCEHFFQNAESSGLLQRILSSLLDKISANSETSLLTNSPIFGYSSSSSPDTSHFGYSNTPKSHDAIRPSKEWWFDDLTILHPNIITKIMTSLNAYGSDNKNLILTKFLLHYLNKVAHSGDQSKQIYSGLADTVIHGVVLMGRKAFSCRGLFWVLRVVTSLGISKDCRQKLESLMGQMLDHATLDDLLVSGHGAVYDVNLVLRLVKIFVDGAVTLPRMKKIGNLLDKYLGEISPDQNLKVDKFLKLAKSLPDSARNCFDGVYRAMDIYLEVK